MPLIAIPNVSESAEQTVVDLAAAVTASGARVLDVHRDHEHARAVLTCTAAGPVLIDAMTKLALHAAESIDLRSHDGAHPRVGALDVCPFVPHELEMSTAIDAARATARSIGDSGIPVFLYGDASAVPRELPEIRSGGLSRLIERIGAGMTPDFGPSKVDPSKGVVCVGARDVLIAFNVWIDGDLEVAREIATRIRAGLGGLPGVRALGLDVSAHGTSQISMNLVDPERTGIDRVFSRIEEVAEGFGVTPVATEIVGLVPERFLPDPDATATRLLVEPGRSLESALRV